MPCHTISCCSITYYNITLHNIWKQTLAYNNTLSVCLSLSCRSLMYTCLMSLVGLWVWMGGDGCCWWAVAGGWCLASCVCVCVYLCVCLLCGAVSCRVSRIVARFFFVCRSQLQRHSHNGTQRQRQRHTTTHNQPTCGWIRLNTEKFTRSRHSKDWQIVRSFLILWVVLHGRFLSLESDLLVFPLPSETLAC